MLRVILREHVLMWTEDACPILVYSITFSGFTPELDTVTVMVSGVEYSDLISPLETMNLAKEHGDQDDLFQTLLDYDCSAQLSWPTDWPKHRALYDSLMRKYYPRERSAYILGWLLVNYEDMKSSSSYKAAAPRSACF